VIANYIYIESYIQDSYSVSRGKEKGLPATSELYAALYVVYSIVIYFRRYSDSRLNSSTSCGVLIAFAFPFFLPASSFLSPLPALRPATSAKLRSQWDVRRGQSGEVLCLHQRCRDPALWCCRLLRKRSFRLQRKGFRRSSSGLSPREESWL
jgi:hypothetical protein